LNLPPVAAQPVGIARIQTAQAETNRGQHPAKMRVGGAMALTKNDIVTAIHEIGFTKKKSVEIIESLLEIIKQRLERGEDVLISGFGKFCVKEKKARRGRNPATGSDLVLRARRIVTFKCSGKLRNKINAES
jgi:integration host factor subunit alpha